MAKHRADAKKLEQYGKTPEDTGPFISYKPTEKIRRCWILQPGGLSKHLKKTCRHEHNWRRAISGLCSTRLRHPGNIEAAGPLEKIPEMKD